MSTNAPIARSTTSASGAGKKSRGASSTKKHKTADLIRGVLLDGMVWEIGEIAKELKIHRSTVVSAIVSLTTIEPRLVEEDDGTVFMVIGG